MTDNNNIYSFNLMCYNLKSKFHFHFVTTVRIWSFDSDFLFKLKMEVSFPKLDSDSVQVTSEKGNFDSNFLFELGFKFE